MMDNIHAMNTKIMISIWPDMAQGGSNNTAMKAIDGLLKDNAHLNILKPEFRQLYWNQANDSLFHYGIDGWWADCSEGYDSDWKSGYIPALMASLPCIKTKMIITIMKRGYFH